MPKFFFHTDDLPDTDGVDLGGLAIAKCEAVKLAGRIICDGSSTFWDSAEWSMTVADEHGLTLFQLLIIGTDAPSIRAEHPSPVST